MKPFEMDKLVSIIKLASLVVATPPNHVAMFTRLNARWLSSCKFARLSTGPMKKIKRTQSLVIRRRGEFIYGVAPCTAALHAKRRKVYAVYHKPGHLEKKAASKRAALENLCKFAEEMKVDYHVVESNTLDKLTGNRPHQGIVMDVAPLNFRRVDLMDCKLSEKEAKDNPVWILLDEIQDPMNLGAILRCSYYLGVGRVIASMKRCCPLSATVSKASAGAMELMPVYSVGHLEHFLKEAKTSGWRILGTSGPQLPEKFEGGKRKRTIPLIDCHEYTKQGPTLLVLGNEGHGLHGEVEEQCEGMLVVRTHRDLAPGFDSLNVAVATGILLHSLQRQSINKNEMLFSKVFTS